MAIQSYGYEGTLNEIGWATLASIVGADFGVDGYGGWKVEIGGAGSRAVTVQKGDRTGGGLAYGFGIADVLTAPATLNATAPGSGDRWDTVVIRRDWQPVGGGTTTLAIVAGGTTRAIASTLNKQPGVICDQPIALIRVNSTSTVVQEVLNVRTSLEKVESYVSADFLPAYSPLGKTAWVLDTGDLWHRRRNDVDDPTWVCVTNPPWTPLTLAGGFLTNSALDGVQIPRYRIRLGRVELRGSIARTNAGAFGTVTNGATVATVPSGFRPNRTAIFATAASYDSANVAARIEVRTDGVIAVFTPSASSHTWVSLEGVSYDATLATRSPIGGLQP